MIKFINLLLNSVNGTSIYASGYKFKEQGDGTTTTYTGSNVKAENELNITSGADTNIIGSKVAGEKVTADIGGNLNIESLKDTETQKWETSGSSISGSIGISGNVIGNGGITGQTNKSKMDSDYNSVTEQAGIYAGDRGFDINVEGNTDLKGGIIDSKAGYEDNTLNTGTITFDDIENKAEYSTSGRGVNVQKTFGNKEGMTDEQKAWEGVTPSTGIGTKDEDESTTKSAIAEARINIMKPENQKQDITKLDRNTRNTLNKLGKIFDKEKVEEKQELAGLFQEMWHTTVGDLMAKSHVITDEQRKALNILGGAIAAELGGADFKAGLVGGATTELLQSAFSQIKDPSLRKVAVAITAAMVAKGTGQEAGTAANVAEAIEVYNHLTHKQYEELQKKLKDANNGNAVKAELMEKEEISVQQEQQWFEEHKNDKPDYVDANGNEYYFPVNVGVDVNGNDVYLFPGLGNKKYVENKNYNVPDTIKNVISKYDYTKLKPGEIYTVSQSMSYGNGVATVSSSITCTGEVYSSIGFSGAFDDEILKKITKLNFGGSIVSGKSVIKNSNGSVVTNNEQIRETLSGISLQLGGNVLNKGGDFSISTNGNRIISNEFNTTYSKSSFGIYCGINISSYHGKLNTKGK